jgi:hypothetical protein
MGFDISSHPIDVGLVQSRLLPYLRGQGSAADLDDLVAVAVRHAQVRFRSNAWGLGLVALSQGKGKAAVPAAFDPDLHVWGRPYFVTADTPQVGEVLDRYLAATPAQADAIAMQQLHALHPDLPNLVQPDTDGALPDDATLARGLRGDLDFLRASYGNLATGKPVKTPDGEATDPEDLFLFTMPLAVVTFAAHLSPGWMARGHVWFTEFLAEAKLDGDGLVESSAAVFEPLLSPIGGWQEAFEPAITQNYAVGGYVRPANVPAFRRYWEAHRPDLVAPYEAEGHAADGAVNWTKIREALLDAERRGFAFLEATEVYSGFMGVMN